MVLVPLNLESCFVQVPRSLGGVQLVQFTITLPDLLLVVQNPYAMIFVTLLNTIAVIYYILFLL